MIAQLRRLVLGETWTLPLGVALTVAAGLALDAAGPGWWHRAGGFVLLAGVLATLAASLRARPPAGARPPIERRAEHDMRARSDARRVEAGERHR